MSTNRYFLLVAAMILSGAFCAAAAVAETQKPAQPYHGLTAVELAPGQSPRLARGFSDLSGSERRYHDRLPVQLSGAIKKVKAAKYAPSKNAPVKRAKNNRS